MPGDAGQCAWLQVMADAAREPAHARRHDPKGGAAKVLAHIREHDSLSLGSYGRPRMTMELKEAGLAVGERRVGRLMRINGIRPVRTRKHKVTTNSNHSLGIAPNLLDGDFVADMPMPIKARSATATMSAGTFSMGAWHLPALRQRP